MSEARTVKLEGMSPAGLRMGQERALEGRVLGRLGGLEVRLAACEPDIELAQALRYRVFYEACGATPSALQRRLRRDVDRFDAHCDHLLLLDADETLPAAERVLGTYRLLAQERAVRACGFYGQSEFDVDSLVRRHPRRRFLELGRSCVDPAHRGRRSMELLWYGVWAYVLERGADVLFGCASLPGTSREALDPQLALLREQALAPAEWRAAPTASASFPLPESSPGAELSARDLPPLVKGYLRLGGMISDHAVIDAEFGTTDVLLVLPLERISPRYLAHFGITADRFA